MNKYVRGYLQDQVVSVIPVHPQEVHQDLTDFGTSEDAASQLNACIQPHQMPFGNLDSKYGSLIC